MRRFVVSAVVAVIGWGWSLEAAAQEATTLPEEDNAVEEATRRGSFSVAVIVVMHATAEQGRKSRDRCVPTRSGAAHYGSD